MYRIALCEDEKIFAEEQARICRRIMEKRNLEHSISVFENAEDFLRVLSLSPSDNTRFDLFLLDIVMNETNGVDLARVIRERDKDAAIIFITANPEYALQGYDVNALHYLIKPIDSGVLEKIITADYEQRFQRDFLIIKTDERNRRIPAQDIVCLEVVGRNVGITLKDGSFEYSGKLSELMEELSYQLSDESFVRCHIGYIVNLKNIKKLTRTQAITVTDKVIPISRAYSNEVQKAFLKQMWEF